MLKSMTGYGRAETVVDGRKYTFEIRSVNHRFLELALKVPREFTAWEERLRKELQGKMARGRVDLFLTVTETEDSHPVVKVDKNLVLAYDKALRELSRELHLPEDAFLGRILDLPDVLKVQAPESDVEETWSAAREGLQAALTSVLEMRSHEGERLAQDLYGRGECLKSIADSIEERAPAVIQDYRQRLLERLQELGSAPVDPARLAQEVAFMAERADIHEEVTRLRSHLAQLEAILQAPEPVGRKLEFLLQEMNREINTIGSKATDLTISSLVIEAKTELEKMREQVQNVE
ncbi:MAG: YicC family protein [Firmicutes bacterium]|nr:YicC family protein [Bacillota bacterium]MCL5038281.1 YicC family protein [Bacillota bacterium]